MIPNDSSWLYGTGARLALAARRLSAFIRFATLQAGDQRASAPARGIGWTSPRGQSLVEWTMIAGVLAAAGILFTELAVPVLRTVVRYVGTSIRTIAP